MRNTAQIERTAGVLTGAALLLAMLLNGCGQVGPPLPPSANLPRPVGDLAVERRGPALRVSFTAPRLTSDGLALRGSALYTLCAWPEAPPSVPAPAACAQPVTVAPAPAAVPPATPGTVAAIVALGDLASPALAGQAHVAVALRARNERGQAAGWSNFATVSLAPVSPPPARLLATPTGDGVRLDWSTPSPPPPAIHLYRELLPLPNAPPASAQRSGATTAHGSVVRLPFTGQPPAAAAPAPIATLPGIATDYLDPDILWNRQYRYWARSANGAVESADSNPALADTRDVFPPPVPTGLEAVLSPQTPPAADLSWLPVQAADLAGYNVYRQQGAGQWEKRNAALLPTPVFHDALPATGGAFRYAVTAIDRSGNESARSPAAVLPPRG